MIDKVTVGFPEAPPLLATALARGCRPQRGVLRPRRLGRSELKAFKDWDDGRPETELNFKLYRQATDKIVGLSKEASEFLSGFF